MKMYKLAVVALCAFLLIACQQTATTDKNLSPTETMRALNDAAEKKDAETMKKLVSAGTLAQLEKSAKDRNSTVDALLREDAPLQELPEMRNEKINGDRATIEIKNTAMETWETMPFVKENGAWKIEFDKFLEEMMRKMTEEMKQIPVNPPSAPSGASASPSANAAANKR